jgi:hypothetical protein
MAPNDADVEYYLLTAPSYTAVINQKVSYPGDSVDRYVFTAPNGTYRIVVGSCGGINTTALVLDTKGLAELACEQHGDITWLSSTGTSQREVIVDVPTTVQSYVEYTLFIMKTN